MENNIIKIINEEGKEENVEIISFYELEEYNHEYVFYTKGEEQGEDIVTYVSIIKETQPGEFKLVRIENDDEYEKVNKLIDDELNSI